MVSPRGTSRAHVHRVGVYGASGTAGAELVTLLEAHPRLELSFATSRSGAGQSLQTVDPALPDLPLTHPEEADPGAVDLVFTALPHGHSAPVVAEALAAGARVVDLSGDFRLRDPAQHQATYGSTRSPELATEAVYGLTEWWRPDVRGARLVANPGCYPTCAALALAPLAARGWIAGPVIIDAKSGVSGAGRSATPATHFLAVADDVRPYKPGRAHRHVPEIEQSLAWSFPDAPPQVVFNPHVVPIARGMLATMVVPVTGTSEAAVREMLAQTYRDEPLVHVLPEGHARIRAVVRTNRAEIGVSAVTGLDHVVVTSAIDNLGKGAAGQALQNANLMLGLPETLGVVGCLPLEVA